MTVKVRLQGNLGYITGEAIQVDAYSILIDRKFLVFNHAIKGMNITKKDHEEISKVEWGQVTFFKEVMGSKKELEIYFEDGTNIRCRLTAYMQDKIFTNDPELSLIQKGSISYIKII